jgi:hypothetical protein
MERFLLRTLARDDVEELVDEVRRTLVGLTRPPRYRAYRLLVDRDWYVEDLARVAEPGLAWKQVVDRLHEDMVRGFDREARRPLAEAVAAEVADPPGLLCFLREVDAQAPAQGGWGYGDLLVALLGDVHPEWWPAVAGTDGGGGPLPPRFQRLVRAMQSQLDLAGLKAAAATVIARPDAMPEDEVVRIVEALWKSPESPDVAALLERLAEHPSVRVREAIVQSLLLSGYRESSPAGAATALRKALRDPVSLELLDRASQGVGDPRYGIPAGPELSVLRAALLDRLATWPNLDLHHAYWLRQFMGRLCEASVDEFLELLDERLRREPVARPPADAEWRHAWIPGGLFDPSGDPPIPPLRRDTTRRVQQWLVDRWLDATNAGRHGPAWHIEMALTEVAGGTKEGPGVGASVALSLVEAWMDAGDLDRAAVLLRGMPATKETIDAGVRFLVAARSREFTGRPASATFRALVRVKQVVMRAMYAPSAEAMTRRSLLEQAVSDARAGSLPVAVLQVLEAALVEVERGIEEDQADHRDQ